jgi:hypothetical protein
LDKLNISDKNLINDYLTNSLNYKVGGKNFGDKQRLYKIITADELIIDKPITVWRGHAREPTVSHKVGDQLTYEHFSSTSTDYEIAIGFMRGQQCCSYEIVITPGMRGLYVDDYLYFGSRAEREFLLPYGMEFKVTHIKKVNGQNIYVLIMV